MICPNCKKNIPDTAKFCVHCGCQLQDNTNEQANRNDAKHAGKKTGVYVGVAVAVIAVAVVGTGVVLHMKNVSEKPQDTQKTTRQQSETEQPVKSLVTTEGDSKTEVNITNVQNNVEVNNISQTIDNKNKEKSKAASSASGQDTENGQKKNEVKALSSDETEESEDSSISSNVCMNAVFAYADMLTELKEDDQTNWHFETVYIDDDLIPELILIGGFDRSADTKIFRYDSDADEVVEVATVGTFGEFNYVSEENLILSSEAGMGELDCIYYTMEKDSLQQLLEAVYYEYDPETGEDGEKYYINDEAVKKSTYEKVVSKYDSRDGWECLTYDDINELNEENIEEMVNNFKDDTEYGQT